MTYDDLLRFIEHDMRMSHVYQPVMLRTLLDAGGVASTQQIARALLNEDQSQVEYYSEITRDMVGRVLRNRHVAEREGNTYRLLDFGQLTPVQIDTLRQACERKLTEYVEKRGDRIWDHRRRSKGYISGTVKYEVLKAAKFHCELCGVSAEERALEVDHIIPRSTAPSKQVAEDPSNLQALCYRCNAMKQNRDDTDFRKVRAAFDEPSPGCVFCGMPPERILIENSLGVAVTDAFPVVPLHCLIIPKRHTSDYFDLGTAELKACQNLLREAREHIQAQDASVTGFNVGVNSGETAGQTIFHCHIHLIPRRKGDVANPRGGVRHVIPGKGSY